MKTPKNLLLALLLLGGILPGFLKAQSSGQGADQSLSPYFEVKSKDPKTDQLPLKSTRADVTIAGVIAEVVVTQVYENTGKNALEAIYVFPGSSRAAVYGMEMKIGDRTLTAQIREREQARKEYEAAKSEGKTASLLEQQRPNVFQMNVANILPGDRIEVVLRYTELLEPVDGQYEFVYPTVVGPRYTGGMDPNDSHNSFTNTPYLNKGEEHSWNFDLDVYLDAGMTIQEVGSHTHKVNLNWEGTRSVGIALDPTETKAGNKDFVLRYRLAGGKIESGILLYEHGDENYFVAMVQPPKRVTPDVIPGREYVFIVDVSGSMNGYPLQVSKKLLRDLITSLRPTDKFNVLLFAGASDLMSEQSWDANEANIEKALNFLENQRAGGGTELKPALQRALALPCQEKMARSFVVITDGYIGMEKECFDLIRNNLNQANLFPFGIGSGVNRHLMEGLAHVGMSEVFVIEGEKGVYDEAERFRKYIQSPVLSHVSAEFQGFQAYDTEPTRIPDVLAERPVIIHGKYNGTPSGKIIVKGYSGEKQWSQTLNLSEYRPSKKNKAIRYLWARKRVQMLDDYSKISYGDESIKKEVTDLGLKYSIMTAYTSFVAVDNVVRRDANGKLVTVKQALPLPENVEEEAVGFDMSVAGVRSAPKEMKVMELKGRKKEDDKSPEPALNTVVMGAVSYSSDANVKSQLETWVKAEAPKLKGSEKLIAGSSQTIQLTIELAKDGTVKNVVINDPNVSETLKRSLTAQIKRWKYSLTALSADLSFTTSLTLTK